MNNLEQNYFAGKCSQEFVKLIVYQKTLKLLKPSRGNNICLNKSKNHESYKKTKKNKFFAALFYVSAVCS